jgi:hypothetical protein
MRRVFWWSLTLISALGLAVAVIPAVGASTHARVSLDARAASVARATSVARAALKHLLVVHPGNQRVPGHNQQISGLTQQGSFNWSGYADKPPKGSPVSKVSGAWTEPGVSCGTQDQIAIFWVGIDGLSPSTTVEQAGTLAQCFQGAAHYYTWWEMYPANGIQVVGSTVKPGDKIAASVVRTGTKYTLKVTDSTTTANSFSTTKSCAATTCVDSSAEWITEAPGGPRGDYPLPDFKTWNLTSASVTAGTKTGGINAFGSYEITMFDGTSTYPLATPGPRTASGHAFTITWNNSY